MLAFFSGDRLKNFYVDLFFFFFFEISPEKNFLKTVFFFKSTCACVLALASSISVLGFERVCSRKSCSWPWPRIFFVSLASRLVSSTPPLLVLLMMKSTMLTV